MPPRKAAPPKDVLNAYGLEAGKWLWIDPPPDLRADPVTVEVPRARKTALTVRLYENPTKDRLVYYLGEHKAEGVGVWTRVYWDKDGPAPLKAEDGAIVGKPRAVKKAGVVGFYTSRPPE